MRAAIIENGVVINVTEVDDEAFASSQGWVVSTTVNIGDSYDAQSGTFTPAVPPPDPTPFAVTRRQAKQQLLVAGLLDQVQPAIDAIPDATQRALVQIYWDDSQEFERQHPELVALATALGLDAAGIDTLFEAAAQR